MEESRTELYYGEGTSDKEYNASLIEVSEGNWNVKIAYGRRGSVIDQGYKMKEHGYYYDAQALYNKLVESKIKKGYEVTYQS